jgi:hypothetical protein
VNAYQLYAEGASLRKQGESLMEKSKAIVTANVSKSTNGKIENEYGRFQLVDYVQYMYSMQVNKLEAELNELKANERKSGEAKAQPKPVLRYTFLNA